MVRFTSKISVDVAFLRFHRSDELQPGSTLASPEACDFLRFVGTVSLRAFLIALVHKAKIASALTHLDGLLDVVGKNRNLRKWTCSIILPLFGSPAPHGRRAFQSSLETFTDTLQNKGVEAEYLGEGKYRSRL